VRWWQHNVRIPIRPILVIAFIAALLEPHLRESYALCVRLILPFKTKCEVNGQIPGCIVFVVPNVRFTDVETAHQLTDSNRSPDDFALAFANSGYHGIDFPPPGTWQSHPVLQWGALIETYCLIEERSATDKTMLVPQQRRAQIVRETLRLAEQECPTNGALWLAEASLDFLGQNETGAVSNLTTAASKENWIWGDANTTLYLTKLGRRSGLSKLDSALAASAANNYQPLELQHYLLQNIKSLMVDSLNQTNFSKFSKLFATVVELRTASWTDLGTPNSFRSFTPGDEVIAAMSNSDPRMHSGLTNIVSFEARRSASSDAFDDFLTRHASLSDVARYFGQRDVHQQERELKRDYRYNHEKPPLIAYAVCSLSGYVAMATLVLSVALLILEIPFLIQKKRSVLWAAQIAAILVAIAFTSYAGTRIGWEAEVGLQTGPAPTIGYVGRSIIIAVVMSLACWLLLVIGRKIKPDALRNGRVAMSALAAFLVSGVLMAICREWAFRQIVENF
jgi:hypothetical protein